MSGLIWMGLGDAIAKAGGTIGSHMSQGIKDEEAERLLELREANAEKRAQALLDAKEAKEESKLQREGLIAQEALRAAQARGEERNFERFARQVGSDTALTPEQLRATYDEFYGGGKEPGYTDALSVKRQDVLDEIRRLGGSPAAIASAQKDRDAAVLEEKNAADAKRKERKDEEDRRANQVREDQRDKALDVQSRRADAAMVAASRAAAGGAKSPAEVKAMTSMDIERATNAARTRLANELGVEDKAVSTTLARLRKSKSPEAKATLEGLGDLPDRYAALLERQMDLERNKPKDEREPTSQPQKRQQVSSTPPLNLLQEGKKTTFANGQVWTVEGGKAKRLN